MNTNTHDTLGIVSQKTYKCTAFNWFPKGKSEKKHFFYLNIDISFEISLNFGSQHSIIAVIILNDESMFKKCDARTNVKGVGQVM